MMSTYEPSPNEVRLTLLLGRLAGPFYQHYIDRLDLPPGARVLDFGSGSGVCSRFLARRLEQTGGRLTCLDVSRTWNQVIRRTLRKHPNVEYRLGSLVHPSPAPVCLNLASYDAVLIHFVLHDLPPAERPQVVRRLAEALTPGGKLFVREPTQRGGIAAPEVLALMAAAGLAEISRRFESHWYTGQIYEAVYVKPGAEAQ